jgi:hypothetical protein
MSNILSDFNFVSFLSEIDRIAARHYQPTDEDVIRARLRTLGVQEYRFVFDHGRYPFSLPWMMYHVLRLIPPQVGQWAKNGGYMTWAGPGVMSVTSRNSGRTHLVDEIFFFLAESSMVSLF